MSATIAERCASEVEDLHATFEAWFRGDVPDTDARFAAVERALAPGFTLVSPRGVVDGRAALMEGIRGGHGRRPGMTIWIEDVVYRRPLAPGLHLVTYQEWQEAAGDRRGRLSTAILEEQGGALRWLHVHETWLEAPGEGTS